MANGERASRLQGRLKEYWGRLNWRERAARRRGERRLVKAAAVGADVADTDRVTSWRGRGEASR